MKKNIPHLRPWIIKDDIRAVNKALSEKCTSHFKYAGILSEKLKNYAGFENCYLYASGTLALRSALLMLKLPKRSAVAIPSFTCQGVLNGVLAAGHKPHIIDCDNRGLMDAGEVLKIYKKDHIAAAVAVHQFGLINEGMAKLARLMPVIEDCSHVPPKAYIKGSRSVYGSLEGTKLLGAGEGGYLLCAGRDEKGDKEMNPVFLGNRLSDVTAVLALCQLKRLSENLRKRKRTAAIYSKSLDSSKIVRGKRAAWFRFLIDSGSLSGVDGLIERAEAAGIALRRPIMPHPLHEYVAGFRKKCPNAENLWKTLVSIPIYPDLKECEIDVVIRFLVGEF